MEAQKNERKKGRKRAKRNKRMKREREEERVSAADWAGNGIEDWLRAELAAHAQIPAEQVKKEAEREHGRKRE